MLIRYGHETYEVEYFFIQAGKIFVTNYMLKGIVDGDNCILVPTEPHTVILPYTLLNQKLDVTEVERVQQAENIKESVCYPVSMPLLQDLLTVAEMEDL